MVIAIETGIYSQGSPHQKSGRRGRGDKILLFPTPKQKIEPTGITTNKRQGRSRFTIPYLAMAYVKTVKLIWFTVQTFFYYYYYMKPWLRAQPTGPIPRKKRTNPPRQERNPLDCQETEFVTPGTYKKTRQQQHGVKNSVMEH